VTGASVRSALVVDDEDDIRSLVRDVLEAEGHRVLEAPDGRAALRIVHQERPALIILDVMMPELDGWQTLERIRDVSDVPVIMLTARGLEWERARGLRAGADDYLTKPFSAIELGARVAALLRRAPQTAERPVHYRDGALMIEFATRTVVNNGEPVSLTPLEFRMLCEFVKNVDQVLTRDELLVSVWGHRDAVFPEQVKLYVAYLRRKLTASGGEPLIETIRGFGYIYRSR
jgi:DNA-binding response OmpR family regulator